VTLRIFDTLSLRKKVFRVDGKAVRMFLCGPTLYDYCHLGHARTFVAFDIIARYLQYLGYRTKVIMNATDISDEILKSAEHVGQSAAEYSDEYYLSLIEDLKALGISTVDSIVRASDNVPQMIAWIERLLDRGVAYVTDEGVFLDTSKVRGYGQLSHQSKAELALRRLELSPDKKYPEDFLVWNKIRTEKNIWDSPWGRGRPGQHIEDAATCTRNLGTSYDINGGGDELVFPHHEAVKAQVEAVTGAPLCRYWLHTGLLRVRKRKMSKSLRNFITIRSALTRYDAPSLRLYFSLTHYRKPLDFRKCDLERAVRMSRRIRESVKYMKRPTVHPKVLSTDEHLDQMISRFKAEFLGAMDDDFNTEKAVKELLDFTGQVMMHHRHKWLSLGDLSKAVRSLAELGGILGIL